MHTNADISSALQQIELVKQAVEESNDPKLQSETADDLKLILDILQDPVFRSIVQVQDSLAELNTQIAQHPSILPGDFDFTPSGDLILTVPPTSDLYDGDFGEDQRDVSPRSPVSPVKKAAAGDDYLDSSGSLEKKGKLKKVKGLTELSRADSTDDERPQSTMSDSARHQNDLQSAEWVQVQAIELVNDGTGLGFGIIGAKTAGVIVKTILAGGVADRDGRLLSGDHILQIGDVNLHEMGSEQVAAVLRQSGTHVRLVVARPVDPLQQPNAEAEGSAIVPSRLLSSPDELKAYLAEAGYPEIFGSSSTPSTPSIQNERFAFAPERNLMEIELPETERFTVELTKDYNGLGITIAGYVCEKEELSGIFVKSVSPGSAADLSGKIQVNDRIVEVDGISLQGFSNIQAVEVLKKSGNVVTLCLERYLRGPKFEQLQQAIAANELKPSTPATPPPPIVPPPPMRSPHDPPRKKHSIENEDFGALNFSSDSFSHEPMAIPMKKINNIDNMMPSAAAQAPAMTTFTSTAVINRNKLMHARDSIETKLAHANGAGEDELTPESAVDDDDEDQIAYRASKYAIEPKLTEEIRAAIVKKWRAILGATADVDIIVAQIRKFAASSGLGISLEGTVDVEGGREVRPHHYIRSILPEGPVGQNGLLRSGDELLEVNGHRLLGMNHLEVVAILKELPQDVRMVCARGLSEMIAFTSENIRNQLDASGGSGTGTADESDAHSVQSLLPADRLVKAKSDGSLATGQPADPFSTKMKSRSLEPLTGLAMWSSEPQIIELLKGERGLGFSILDYQDPLDPNDTLIVIRSLVPGGVAQLDGRLIPGDRLLFVNDTNLENASLDQAVQALKGAPKGVVRIGVAKPLPMADTSATTFGGKPDVIRE